MLVRDLKKGMLLKFDPKLTCEFLETSSFVVAGQYLFFSRMGIYEEERCREGPFLYLGHRYEKIQRSGKKRPSRVLVREILCKGVICTIWGYDFRHLEPIGENSE